MKYLQQILLKLEFSKLLLITLPFIFAFFSCSIDEYNYINIEGKVIRTINGDGVANQSVTVISRIRTRTGLLSTTRDLDQTNVKTDENGNFSTNLIKGNFVSIIHQGDEDFSGSGILRDYSINEEIIIESNKLVKFKILVKNTNPLDENDFIKIHFFNGLGASEPKRTSVTDFGLNLAELINWKETTWTGTDVNSSINYSVDETSQDFKILWIKRKNGIETSGFTNDIPYNLNQLNIYTFEY